MADLNAESLALHKKLHGKLGTMPKGALQNGYDLSIMYTPGVAEPCRKIKDNPELSFDLTLRGNCVAVITDGTRVLGLGNIGAAAAMPVMEGKGVLYKVFGDIDSVPVCLDLTDKDEFIKTVKYLQKNYAGINLEDIQSPKCYDIEDELIKELEIPVFHDDQHGTAIACLSGLLGALRLVKKDIKDIKVVLNGFGAAGTAIGRLLFSLGCKNLIALNSKGALYKGFDGKLDRVQKALIEKPEFNPEGLKGDLATVAKGADVLLGVSAPNVFTPEIIRSMNKDAIVFAMANPVPETTYKAAKEAGAKVAGTGRSDAPNQINNVCVFPGIFRGALDVKATCINDAMKMAATRAIAEIIKETDLAEDYVVPAAFDVRNAPSVARAVAKAAMESGVARVKVDPQEVYDRTMARTAHTRALMEVALPKTR